ncbi:MAG: radical SAM family heme chaperone HemW, partial [Bacteroidia bacterium]|nr:radical SAM family heme chaperone HemW [Bacteroidia bacterium]
SGESIKTIYFGGGTPSVLPVDSINKIIDNINKIYKVEKNLEITFEANSEDLSFFYLNKLAETPINRLSIGVQSFFDDDLKLLNRRHNACQAEDAIKTAINLGFNNINIDLIYGLPGLSIEKWRLNLEKIVIFNIQHFSAYHLSYEPGTILTQLTEKGKLEPISEQLSIEQYNLLASMTAKNGYIHYEISNFGKQGYFSVHNSNYWKRKKYIGIGPSAHSYNYYTRQWNCSDINNYIKAINKNIIPATSEFLSEPIQYNEYILISLRTIWGIDINYISQNFGQKYLNHIFSNVEKFIKANLLQLIDNNLIITEKGMFVSDSIIRSFIMES